MRCIKSPVTMATYPGKSISDKPCSEWCQRCHHLFFLRRQDTTGQNLHQQSLVQAQEACHLRHLVWCAYHAPHTPLVLKHNVAEVKNGSEDSVNAHDVLVGETQSLK